MEIAEHIQVVDAEGRLLAAAAEKAGTDAQVATCPGWQIRDLVRHQGSVHRWATAFVAEGLTERRPMPEAPADTDGDALLAWFREGHHRLVDTLTNARPGLECFAFLPAPSPLAFWARRQAHETTVHRVDAQSALHPVTAQEAAPIGAEFAVDGIDELLLGFHARQRSRMRSDAPRVLRVRATDADVTWTVRVTQDPPAAERGATADAECEVSGPAARLYLALWNRLPFPAVSGDFALAEQWRERAGV
ncbi:maleylpyruvate isomerase family mycothiol-dependent enzyme [Streptomyces sp. VRA16 Mangrove soil]|uniref:maleylpyruvate isomerase family mycothiol-dependent enzyme n=1 Tax=Streptomyces sp. VRA16 Mangrove soil TaxID=2817434 RepID=UPI001A9E248C|nr:maleylpyruvate isomerase family mycothiol-dependent enzyme [Streptomyces sp. VRA16 Mangrove soil]MBO1334481.1 maleylpyruvate isomerase family mycothiol-dependent enzyme [Streptomyces sp. VRA16 Mangrove soil]